MWITKDKERKREESQHFSPYFQVLLSPCFCKLQKPYQDRNQEGKKRKKKDKDGGQGNGRKVAKRRIECADAIDVGTGREEDGDATDELKKDHRQKEEEEQGGQGDSLGKEEPCVVLPPFQDEGSIEKGYQELANREDGAEGKIGGLVLGIFTETEEVAIDVIAIGEDHVA